MLKELIKICILEKNISQLSGNHIFFTQNLNPSILKVASLKVYQI